MPFGSRSIASRYPAKSVQVHSIPAASAAGAMSSARSRLRTTSSCASSRVGASVKPQCPMTTVVTPCQHEFVPSSSQNTWASMCVWASMKPGVTTWPSASMSVAPRSLIRPIRAIRPSTMPTSARNGARPVPSTTVPLRMTVSKLMDCCSWSGAQVLGAQVSGVEIEHGDRVPAHEQLELVGRHARCDFGHQCRRVGPGRVLVRVVGLEAELLDPDQVAHLHADHVVEERAVHPARYLG